jgi:hypothetical protein
MKTFKSFLEERRCWPGHKPVPGKKPYSPGSCVKEEVLKEGRPSQRHPLEGHDYHKKSNAELEYIAKDAHKAAEAMKSHNTNAENKYRDQANDSATVRYWRQKNGMPNWYKKKYGHMKEEIELDEAIPKSTMHAVVHSSSRKIVAKGNKKEMLKKMKELNNKEKESHHLGMTIKGKVGDTFGEEVELDEVAAWQRKEGKNPEGGLNQKGVESYRRENPGSKLQTAVTTEPSKLKPGSKAAKRRLSFCRRMKGMKEKLTSAETARDPDSRINKSLRKWNC